MKIETKFNLGDEVFAIQKDRLQQEAPCSVCKDTHKISVEGVEFRCPQCGGDKYWKYQTRWFVPFSSKIGQISYIERLAKYESYGRYDELSPSSNMVEIRYMLEETGVGSGTCWDEHLLFATREEATAQCERLNCPTPSPTERVAK